MENKISGKVISQGVDKNGNIQVEVEYTNVDGDKIIGKLAFDATRFNRESLTQAIKEHVDRMIIKVGMLKLNSAAMVENDFVGLTYESSSAEIVTKYNPKEVKKIDLNEI